MVDISLRGVFAGGYDTGIADHDRVRRHIAVDKRIRRDHHIVADGDLADNGRVHTDPHAVADRGGTLSRAAILLTDRDTLVDVAVFAVSSWQSSSNQRRATAHR